MCNVIIQSIIAFVLSTGQPVIVQVCYNGEDVELVRSDTNETVNVYQAYVLNKSVWIIDERSKDGE